MKRLSFMVSMAMLISCVASCDSGSDAVSYGVGTLSLGLSANPSFSTKTRSVNEAEYKKADNYQVTVKDADGASLYNGLYKDMPLSIDLTAGKGYTVKAFYGENVNAGFDKLYVEGSQEFTVSEGEQKNVILYCKPANVKVSVIYTEDFLKYYSDSTVSLSTSHLTAPFEVNMKKDSGKDAYLKANADGEKVSITVGGFRDKEGNEVVMEALVAEKKVAPKTHLTITVDPEVITISTGTASLDVTVDTGTEDKDVNIEIPEEYWPGNASK